MPTSPTATTPQQPVRILQVRRWDDDGPSGEHLGPTSHRHRSRVVAVGSFIGILNGLIALAIGAAIAAVGWITIEDSSPPEGGTITTAVVVDTVEGRVLIDKIPRRTYSPVYEYQDASGETHRVIDRINPGNRPPAVGSTVEVSYIEGDPQSVRRTGLVADWMRWLLYGGVAVAAGGLLLVVASLAAGFASPKRRRRRRPQRVGTSPFVD